MPQCHEGDKGGGFKLAVPASASGPVGACWLALSVSGYIHSIYKCPQSRRNKQVETVHTLPTLRCVALPPSSPGGFSPPHYLQCHGSRRCARLAKRRVHINTEMIYSPSRTIVPR